MLTRLKGLRGVQEPLVELKRLEDDGDRVVHDAIAALFRDDRIDPLIVIRWKDVYEGLERAIDSCETAANVVANIAVKNAYVEDLTLVAVIVVALFFDFTNGFHDTANSIATSVSTRALSPRAAVISAAVLNVARRLRLAQGRGDDREGDRRPGGDHARTSSSPGSSARSPGT